MEIAALLCAAHACSPRKTVSGRVAAATPGAGVDRKRLIRIGARVFAKFAATCATSPAPSWSSIADADINQLGRFVLPQFRVHPELVKLARQVYEQHPVSRKQRSCSASSSGNAQFGRGRKRCLVTCAHNL